jgi:DNA-binding XRE family transcriptional regulator
VVTWNQNLNYEDLLTKCRVFVELLPMYLRCSSKVQEIIVEMAKLIGSPESAEEDRERACGTVAGALLAFATDEQSSAHRPHRLSIPSETRALMAEHQRALAARLKSLRQEKNWTQEELARRSGVGQSAISTIENGQCRPQAGTLVKLAEALGVSKNEFLPQSQEHPDEQPTIEQKARNGQMNAGRKGAKH